MPLAPAPIQPDWVRGGTPDASNAILSWSADKSAYTMVWDCTEGSFEWTYDCDETVYILEGSILLTDAGNPTRRLSAGEAVFFPRGAKVHWQVEGYVRKIAFMRETLPGPVALGMKLYRRLRGLMRARSAPTPARPIRVMTTPEPVTIDKLAA
jgi:uncharacterized cupin superfamily protein